MAFLKKKSLGSVGMKEKKDRMFKLSDDTGEHLVDGEIMRLRETHYTYGLISQSTWNRSLINCFVLNNKFEVIHPWN